MSASLSSDTRPPRVKKEQEKKEAPRKPVPASAPSASAAAPVRARCSQLFDHLPRQEALELRLDAAAKTLDVSSHAVHPATLQLSAYYRHGSVREDDERVVALLSACQCFIRDYHTPAKKLMALDMDKYVSCQVQYLIKGRQHCIGKVIHIN